MTGLLLLGDDGTTSSVALAQPPERTRPDGPLTARTVFAAAHVVPRRGADTAPGAPADVDWDTTIAFRHHLWSWGLGVADAMDTAQRGQGLDPAAVRELVTRSARAAASVGGSLVVGVGTDDIDDGSASLDDIVDAYVRQLHHAEDVGAGVVVMASRQLARAASGPDDYRSVYRRVIGAAAAPVVLHWLGAVFDPALSGYFGDDTAAATGTVLSIIEEHADQVAGIKMSLLDAEAEVAVRARLPRGVAMYTGDDHHYVDLIAGTDGRHSDALLGAFAAIAPAASAAVQELGGPGGEQGFRRVLEPTEALSRQVFSAPTWYYKTGVAFLSWLNGHQRDFSMVGGLETARSLPHLSETLRLANACGALEDPELARHRWHAMLARNAVELP